MGKYTGSDKINNRATRIAFLIGVLILYAIHVLLTGSFKIL